MPGKDADPMQQYLEEVEKLLVKVSSSDHELKIAKTTWRLKELRADSQRYLGIFNLGQKVNQKIEQQRMEVDDDDGDSAFFQRYFDCQLAKVYFAMNALKPGEELLENAASDLNTQVKEENVAIVIYILNQCAHYYGIQGEGRAEGDHQREDDENDNKTSGEDLEKALGLLEKADQLYEHYKTAKPKLPTDLLVEVKKNYFKESTDEEKLSYFEEQHRNTQVYLSKVYRRRNENDKAIRVITKMLQHQSGLSGEKRLPADWARYASQLARHYLDMKNFPEARHCIASGRKALEGHDLTYNNKPGSAYHALIVLNRVEAKYLIAMLSKDRQPSNKTASMRIFEMDVSEYEQSIPIGPITGFDQARAIFLRVQSLLISCLSFFIKDRYLDEYIDIIRDYNRLFERLIKYEDKPQRKCKMYKRRIHVLEDLMKEIKPRQQTKVQLELAYELGGIYQEMMKCKKGYNDNTKKVNALGMKSIVHYLSYEKLLQNFRSKKLPVPLPPGTAKPLLMSWWNVAELRSKISPSKSPEPMRRDYMQPSSAEYYYIKIADFCEEKERESENLKELISEEYERCVRKRAQIKSKEKEMEEEMKSGGRAKRRDR